MNLNSRLTGNLSERRIIAEWAPSSRLTVTGRHLSADVGQRSVTDGQRRASDLRMAPQSRTQQSARFVHMTVTRTISRLQKPGGGGYVFKVEAGSELETRQRSRLCG